MPNVLVRNVPEPVLDALKLRAERNRRSLQQELIALFEAASDEPSSPMSPAEAAAEIQEYFRRSGRIFSDSSELVREDRDR